MILQLVGVLVNGAISSLRNGSKLSVKTIMNNMPLQQKGSNPAPEQVPLLPVGNKNIKTEPQYT